MLAEARRVTRPGGRIVVFDGDNASLGFGRADGRLGREMEAALLRVVVSRPRVMRELPALLAALGLEPVRTRAYAHAEIGTGSFFPGMAEAFAPLVTRAGLVATERAGAWLAEQRRNVAEGVFFAACTYYTYVVAVRPGGAAGPPAAPR